ncbi:hypothetical protein KFE25_008131 [Diacronema lutheri]|uniref:C2 domain-containing protein n=2 Tax=Diacronema lutheri TaxID=2081491 RepID=A0A8J5XNB7_DIALT|nr:hypothetical protein KFE25_008131 [Diacronema lutheri]
MLVLGALIVAGLHAPHGARAPPARARVTPRARSAMLAPALTGSAARDDVDCDDSRPPFDFDRSVELASLAFHTYVPVTGGKWERGSDSTDVAFQRAGFVTECYTGVLVVTLHRVRGLFDSASKAGAGEALLTGGALDPYALLSVVEGRRVPTKADATVPVRDVCRSRTQWRMGEGNGERRDGGGKPAAPDARADAARAPDALRKERAAGVVEFDETFYLYVGDLATARLRLTLRDENVAKDDDTLGSATLPIAPLASRPSVEQSCTLAIKYNAPIGPGMAAGAVAGGLFGGLVGAGLGAAAAAIAERWTREATAELTCKFIPFASSASPSAPASSSSSSSTSVDVPDANAFSDEAMAAIAASALNGDEQADLVKRAVARAQEALATRRVDANAASVRGGASSELASDAAAQALGALLGADSTGAERAVDAAVGNVTNALALGGTEGIDWTTLGMGGGEVNPRRFELIAYVDNAETDTQAAVWRDCAARELVLSFRGTEQTAWKDLIIDAMVLQQPWSVGGANTAGARAGALEPFVHSGFRTAWASVAPRVFELIAGAIGARAYDPDARARVLRRPRWTLFCTGHSLGGALATLAALEIGQSALPLARIALYTYGAPRVGNADLCALIDAYVPEAFRIVNGQDLVTRMPRGAAAETLGRFAGGILDYRHPGRTVLVDEREPLCAVAGAGLERECPLELLDSPFADPLGAIDEARGDNAAGAAGGGVRLDTDDDGVPDARLLPALEEVIERMTGAGWEEAGGAIGTLGALQRAAGQVAQTLTESVSGAGKGVTLKDVAALAGIRGRFVEAELSLLSSITSGIALEHHLEPSYFKAMSNAQAAVREGRTPEGRKA